jgi:putative ABC transport system permease protein
MNLTEAIRFSLQALEANRLRTFLTALGLIIGNASVILVVTISLASKDLILDQIRGIGSNLIYAQYEAGGQSGAKVDSDFIKLADVKAIREELSHDIIAATAVMPSNDRIVINGKERDVSINGIDEYYPDVRNIVVLAGRLMDPGDVALRSRVALVTEKLAKRLAGSSQAAIGRKVKIHELQFTVIGAFREKTSTFGESEVLDETILIPITVSHYFTPVERIDPLYVQAKFADEVPRVTDEIRQILQRLHRPGANYTVQNLSSILETANKIATVMTIVLIIVSAIALIISGIGIMNIMLVTVTERTREIGLRMAVGASRHDVLGQFLTESVMISLIGGFIGIIIGISVPLGAQLAKTALPLDVRVVTDTIRLPISPLSVLAAFLVSFTVGIGFGLLPANRASRLNPTEALRYE